jgi:hypothetical protein
MQEVSAALWDGELASWPCALARLHLVTPVLFDPLDKAVNSLLDSATAARAYLLNILEAFSRPRAPSM